MAVVQLDKRRQQAAGAQIGVRVMTITPELAEEWLGKNIENRRISKRNTEAYARDMRSEAFKISTDAIGFDMKGNLINGQHRLLGCIDARVPFDAIVVEGLPTETRNVIDGGLKRNLSDALHFEGHVSTFSLSAALSWLNRIKQGTGDPWAMSRLTMQEGISMLERHPKLAQSVSFVGCAGISQRGSVIGPPPGLATAMHYVCAFLLKQPELAGRFVDVFRNGTPAYKGDPCILWRERLIRHRNKGLSLSRDEHLRGLAHCWNLFAKHRKVEQFKVPEEFRIEDLDPRKI